MCFLVLWEVNMVIGKSCKLEFFCIWDNNLKLFIWGILIL